MNNKSVKKNMHLNLLHTRASFAHRISLKTSFFPSYALFIEKAILCNGDCSINIINEPRNCDWKFVDIHSATS